MCPSPGAPKQRPVLPRHSNWRKRKWLQGNPWKRPGKAAEPWAARRENFSCKRSPSCAFRPCACSRQGIYESAHSSSPAPPEQSRPQWRVDSGPGRGQLSFLFLFLMGFDVCSEFSGHQGQGVTLRRTSQRVRWSPAPEPGGGGDPWTGPGHPLSSTEVRAPPSAQMTCLGGGPASDTSGQPPIPPPATHTHTLTLHSLFSHSAPHSLWS